MIANHITYDSFGQVASETNSAVDVLFGYTGRPLDEHTGLQNNHHRWYDALTHVWISQDAIGFLAGDANLNRYVGNSPTNATDPTGLDDLGNIGPDIAAATAAAAATAPPFPQEGSKPRNYVPNPDSARQVGWYQKWKKGRPGQVEKKPNIVPPGVKGESPLEEKETLIIPADREKAVRKGGVKSGGVFAHCPRWS